MIYKVSYETRMCESHGFSFFGSKKAAFRDAARQNKLNNDFECLVTEFETPTTKAEVLSILNIHGGHPNNG